MTKRVVPKEFYIEFTLNDMKVYRTDIFTDTEPHKSVFFDLEDREFPELPQEATTDPSEEQNYEIEVMDRSTQFLMMSLDVSLSNVGEKRCNVDMTGGALGKWNMNRTLECDSQLLWISYHSKSIGESIRYSFEAKDLPVRR